MQDNRYIKKNIIIINNNNNNNNNNNKKQIISYAIGYWCKTAVKYKKEQLNKIIIINRY